MTKGTVQDKGKRLYQIRIEKRVTAHSQWTGSSGTASDEKEKPAELLGISVSPRRSLTVPATEDVVKSLGLKKGIKLVALQPQRALRNDHQ